MSVTRGAHASGKVGSGAFQLMPAQHMSPLATTLTRLKPAVRRWFTNAPPAACAKALTRVVALGTIVLPCDDAAWCVECAACRCVQCGPASLPCHTAFSMSCDHCCRVDAAVEYLKTARYILNPYTVRESQVAAAARRNLALAVHAAAVAVAAPRYGAAAQVAKRCEKRYYHVATV